MISGKTPDENNLLQISCSYDMGWQKRGKGFNSNTGPSAAMGVQTGKVHDKEQSLQNMSACKQKQCSTSKTRLQQESHGSPKG